MLGLGLGLRSMGQSLQQEAMGILRSFGPDASSYPFSTLQGAYQTSAGPAAAAAAAAVNDPVGLELDALGTVGPELVTNSGGPFTATTGYVVQATGTMSVDAGRLKVVQLAAWTDGIFYYLPAVTTGCTVKVTVVVDLGTATLVQIQLGGNFDNGASGLWNITASGTYDLFGVWAGGGVGGVTVKSSSASTFYISSVHAVEVTGNHATQTTAGDRPTLQQDGGGRWYASFNGPYPYQALHLASTLTAVAGTFICCARANVLHFGTLVGNGGIFVSEPGISLGTANNGALRAVFGNGTIAAQVVSTVDTYTPGEIFVVSVQWDMSFVKIRKNSGTTVQVANTLGDLTSATLGSIGRVGPLGVDCLSGSIYDAIAIKGVVSASQLLTLEKAAAQRAGLVL